MNLGLSPDQTRRDFKEMRSQAEMAESLDFTALWVHEHHSQAMMYPDPLMALAALVPVTGKVRLGTSMLLLPLHHPVRMAQAAAMLDVMSEGRVLLGVANGYSATDLATFGLTGKHRGRRVQQGIELARRLWLGEPVTASGDDFVLDDFILFPPPVQKPGPPILLGGHADVAIERAARIGDGFFISATAGIEQVAALVDKYRFCLDRQGKPFHGVWLNRVTCVVENHQQKEAARDFFAKALIALYDSWGHANVAKMSQQQRRVEDICRNNLIIGEAEECHDQIAAYAELGVRHIACLTSFGAPPAEVARRSIRVIGEKIIPKLAAMP